MGTHSLTYGSNSSYYHLDNYIIPPSEEWAWIKSFKSPSCPKHLLSTDPLSLQNTLFPTLELFLKNLGFNKEEADQHQFYIHEAIELNEDTTILLVMPSHDNVCTAPGSSDHFADTPDFVALPINGFEISKFVLLVNIMSSNY